ncbi:MAG: quinohemoprotein amine dehydrogenase subunit alpha [Acidobacteriota bacterium]
MRAIPLIFLTLTLATYGFSQGIPVTDPLVVSKCASCHAQDERGIMQRISFERTTPEAWQEILKRMIGAHGVSVTPVEARGIVKYLSDRHGLAPQEAKAVAYDTERRVHEETNIPSESLKTACARCHGFARALSWRRSPEDWKLFLDEHAAANKVASQEAIDYLAKAAPLHNAEYDAWNARAETRPLAGRWEVVASTNGHAKYYGEMQITSTGTDEFETRMVLISIQDGTEVLRSGRSAVYGGSAWRGRSKGSEAPKGPADLLNETREVMSIAANQATIEGRWFWGQYQEFGMDVRMVPDTRAPVLLTVQPSALRRGTEADRLRLLGNNFPADVPAAVLSFGDGVTLRKVISSQPHEIVVEVDVAANAPMGPRFLLAGRSSLPDGLIVYDRIDYIKAVPDAAMASFADKTHAAGYQKLEAIGYQRGSDGKLHTADDLDLGPVDADWRVDVFYTPEGSDSSRVASMSAGGLLTPAAVSPGTNFDVWVVATAKSALDKDGQALVGKSYVVVTVPTYMFNGRQFIRDLDRWVDDGPAQETTK